MEVPFLLIFMVLPLPDLFFFCFLFFLFCHYSVEAMVPVYDA